MRTSIKFILLLFVSLSFFSTAEAKNSHESIDMEVEKNAAEGIALIADRMKSLSGSLNQLPEPPRLDQTIDLPIVPEAHASDGDEEKQS